MYLIFFKILYNRKDSKSVSYININTSRKLQKVQIIDCHYRYLYNTNETKKQSNKNNNTQSYYI